MIVLSPDLDIVLFVETSSDPGGDAASWRSVRCSTNLRRNRPPIPCVPSGVSSHARTLLWRISTSATCRTSNGLNPRECNSSWNRLNSEDSISAFSNRLNSGDSISAFSSGSNIPYPLALPTARRQSVCTATAVMLDPDPDLSLPTGRRRSVREPVPRHDLRRPRPAAPPTPSVRDRTPRSGPPGSRSQAARTCPEVPRRVRRQIRIPLRPLQYSAGTKQPRNGRVQRWTHAPPAAARLRGASSRRRTRAARHRENQRRTDRQRPSSPRLPAGASIVA